MTHSISMYSVLLTDRSIYSSISNVCVFMYILKRIHIYDYKSN